MISPRHSHIARERGIVLFVALIVMVAMSLAAIALIRSVDTANTVIGNLAFRQASILPANYAVEQAAAALFSDVNTSGVPAITDPTADLPAQNYYASWQASDDARGIPAPLQTLANWNSAGLGQKLIVDVDQADANAKVTEIRYVIERMCVEAGPAAPKRCDMLPPKQNPGTTVHDESAPTLNPIPFYRVTIRVDGPKNTASFLQAMLR